MFLSEPNGNKKNIINAHEGTFRMTVPLFLLSILSIFVGFLTKEIFIGFGTFFWNSSLFVLPQNYLLTDVEFIDLFYKLLPLLFTLLSMFIVYFTYVFNSKQFFLLKTNFLFKKFYSFLNKKWYFDRIYNEYVTQSIISSGYFYTYKDVDRGLIEKLGPSGIISGVKDIVKTVQILQTGFIYYYLYLFLVSFLLILFLLVNISIFLTSLNFIFFLTITHIFFNKKA